MSDYITEPEYANAVIINAGTVLNPNTKNKGVTLALESEAREGDILYHSLWMTDTEIENGTNAGMTLAQANMKTLSDILDEDFVITKASTLDRQLKELVGKEVRISLREEEFTHPETKQKVVQEVVAAVYPRGGFAGAIDVEAWIAA